MTSDDRIKKVGDSVTIVAELIKTAGDTPEAKEAGKNIGQAAVTITKTINNALLPLAAINFGFDKARKYFDQKFNSELTEKAKYIPGDQITEPKPSLAGPILQGLAFTHEELDLKNMYLNLLATAMDKRTSNEAHPAFVEIIKQLTAEEAHLLKDMFQIPNTPNSGIVEIILRTGRGQKVVATHVVNFVDEQDRPFLKPNLPTMIDNMIRLGLMTVDYTHTLVDENIYKYAETRPEYLNNKHLENANEKLEIRRGILKKTSLGVQFGLSVGLTENTNTD